MTEHEIILIDKPTGITSFDVIRRLRAYYKRRGEKPPKMGHAGTLDPAASVLMLIGIGRSGTKRLNELTGLDKTYEVTAELGVRTDTGDRDGEVVERTAVSGLDHETLTRACAACTGTLRLPVPRYSAIKVDGGPLYKKARRGEEFDPPTREMIVHDIRYTDLIKRDDAYLCELEMDVASGVYVRSVVEALGRELGVPATTAALRRTRIGMFRLEDAEPL